MIKLSTSGAKTWLTCRMKWYWQYEQDLAAKKQAPPLQIGKVVHDLRHKYYTGELQLKDLENLDTYVSRMYPSLSPEEAYDIAYESAKYINGYIQKYEDDPLTFISSEMILELPRKEPQTGIEYTIHMIIDAIARTRDGRLWRDELKTTARMDSFYLSGLRGGLQGGIYHWGLCNVMPEPIAGTIYNIIVKTKVPQYERMPVLIQKSIADRALETFDGVVRDIISHDVYKNCDQCFAYNRQCDFIPLCNTWQGEWNDKTLRIKDSFFESREARKEAERRVSIDNEEE